MHFDILIGIRKLLIQVHGIMKNLVADDLPRPLCMCILLREYPGHLV